MPQFSVFSAYGQLEYSSAPSDAEAIYDAAAAGYIDPLTGDVAVDMTEGTYHEAKLYARAMALADARAAVRRASSEEDTLKATAALPHYENTYRIVPAPTDTLDVRRSRVAARRKRSRGNRFEALHEKLTDILGDALLAIRPIPLHEATSWPAAPGSGPGVFVRNDQPAKVVRFRHPVTILNTQTEVMYENWDTTQPPLQLVKGDVLSVQPENPGLSEKVTIAHVDGAGPTRTLTATFGISHDGAASATTGPAPLWWSTIGHMLVVVTHEAAMNADVVGQVDEYLGRALKSGTTWSIIEPTTAGASTLGPFTLGESPLGAVPLTSLPLMAAPPPTVGRCSPLSGAVAGGALVTLYGRRLSFATDVQIDGTSVGFSAASDHELRFITPPHAAGPVAITVTTPFGTTTNASTTAPPLIFA